MILADGKEAVPGQEIWVSQRQLMGAGIDSDGFRFPIIKVPVMMKLLGTSEKFWDHWQEPKRKVLQPHNCFTTCEAATLHTLKVVEDEEKALLRRLKELEQLKHLLKP